MFLGGDIKKAIESLTKARSLLPKEKILADKIKFYKGKIKSESQKQRNLYSNLFKKK